MSEDYRVPVLRRRAQVWLVGGEERNVELFCPPDASVESLLEDERRFLPSAAESGVFLVARCAVVALSVDRPASIPSESESGVPIVSRRVAITLHGGRRLRGHVRFVVASAQDRTADFMNEACPYVTLYREEDVVHVVKDHVVFVEEEGERD